MARSCRPSKSAATHRVHSRQKRRWCHRHPGEKRVLNSALDSGQSRQRSIAQESMQMERFSKRSISRRLLQSVQSYHPRPMLRNSEGNQPQPILFTFVLWSVQRRVPRPRHVVDIPGGNLSLARKAPPALGLVSAAVPVRAHGLTLYANLAYAGSKGLCFSTANIERDGGQSS